MKLSDIKNKIFKLIFNRIFKNINSEVPSTTLDVVEVMYVVDTSSESKTITLPSDPEVGDRLRIVDRKGTFHTNNVTLNRNGKMIMNKEEDYILDVNNTEYLVIYIGNDEWRVI